MEAAEAIMLALAATMTTEYEPNNYRLELMADEIVEKGYELRDLIKSNYAAVDVDVLDIGPANAERQEQLRSALAATGADEDERVCSQSEILLRLVHEYFPTAATALERDPAELLQAADTLAP